MVSNKQTNNEAYKDDGAGSGWSRLECRVQGRSVKQICERPHRQSTERKGSPTECGFYRLMDGSLDRLKRRKENVSMVQDSMESLHLLDRHCDVDTVPTTRLLLSVPSSYLTSVPKGAKA